MGDRNELDRVSSLSARFAATIERRAPWIIAAWIVAAVVMTLVAPSLNDVGSQDTADFLPGDAPSQQADRLLAERFPDDPTREAAIIVIARDGGLRPGDQAYVKDLVEDLRSSRFSDDISGVQTAASDPALAAFLRSKDGSAELIVASMRRAPFSTTGTAAIENLRHHLELTAPSELDAHVTGLAGLAADQAQGVIESFDRTAIVTVILVLIILLLIYRSVVAALIPLVTIGLAFGVSNGLVAYLADAGLKVNTMVGTFLVVMIFGAGTDYCLFLTSRYREDLALGEPDDEGHRCRHHRVSCDGHRRVHVDDHSRLRHLQDHGSRHRHRDRRHPGRRPDAHPRDASDGGETGLLASPVGRGPKESRAWFRSMDPDRERHRAAIRGGPPCRTRRASNPRRRTRLVCAVLRSRP
jgi:RND superfamily putative drug exporter